MKIEKVNLSTAQAARLLPVSAACYISEPGTHVFACLYEEKEGKKLSALSLVTKNNENRNYVLRFIGYEEEKYIKDCMALIKHIEMLCGGVGLICELAGDEEYLREADSIMKAAGYKGEDTSTRYLEYDASVFFISPLGGIMEKVTKITEKLKGYDAYPRSELAAFSKAAGVEISKNANARYFDNEGKILGMIDAGIVTDNTVYVRHLNILGADKRVLSVMLSYAANLAMEADDTTIIFETEAKGLINGLMENLGNPMEDTKVKIYRKA